MGREMKLGDRRSFRWELGRVAEGDEIDSRVVLPIDSKQLVDGLVYKPQNDSHRHLGRGSFCQNIRQNRAIIPEGMAVCSCPRFPDIWPEPTVADDHNHRPHHLTSNLWLPGHTPPST